jgi:hypothetical protein
VSDDDPRSWVYGRRTQHPVVLRAKRPAALPLAAEQTVPGLTSLPAPRDGKSAQTASSLPDSADPATGGRSPRARRPGLQRLVELVLGLPRGSVVALDAAREFRSFRLQAETAIRARDRQIADHRQFLIRHDLINNYWSWIVAREAEKARPDNPASPR